MRRRNRLAIFAASLILALVIASPSIVPDTTGSASAAEYKMTTKIPPGIAIAGQGGDPPGHAEVLRRLPGRCHRREALRQSRLPARRAGLPAWAGTSEPGGESQGDPRGGAGQYDRADLRDR